ncbi:hypothetical protein SAMN02745753_02690 [Marinomonas polaris DSM 16579]|uniref:Uncharacterized protein n=1 Tax=Marinomonas polaris DSM 16579 TaxID=1122206 RepID=A0A1M5EN84_9GAMM|nr:hypothetical protein [Marinomonas polaris]SHF80551.1 hypothetical protein SAMN02745753_02690 [Marinomonas polaris DSM 16579]
MEDKKKDFHFWIFLFVSVIWSIRVFWLLIEDQYSSSFNSQMPLNEVGDFLSGSFSPLAFAWLAYGYWMQNKEISMNREELMISRKALEAQAKELANSVDQQKYMAAIAKQEIEYNKALNLERKVENSIKHLPLICWNSFKSAKSNDKVQENNKTIKL